jgi:peptidoglycan-associated lipoprotein
MVKKGVRNETNQFYLEFKMKMLKSLLLLTIVLAAPVYFSACASNGQKVTSAGPSATDNEAKAQVVTKRGELAAQEKAKQEKIREAELERQRQEELERQRRESLAKQNEEARSSAFIDEQKTVHFDFNKFDVKPEDRDILSKNAEIIKTHPAVPVVISGNCDERGTQEYNLALGNARAVAAKKYLVSLGVDDSKISTISYGLEKPVDRGHNEKAWAKNRRDEFTKN